MDEGYSITPASRRSRVAVALPPPGAGKVGYPYKPLPPGSNTRIEWMHSLTVKPILQAFVNQTSLTGAG